MLRWCAFGLVLTASGLSVAVAEDDAPNWTRTYFLDIFNRSGLKVNGAIGTQDAINDGDPTVEFSVENGKFQRVDTLQDGGLQTIALIGEDSVAPPTVLGKTTLVNQGSATYLYGRKIILEDFKDPLQVDKVMLLDGNFDFMGHQGSVALAHDEYGSKEFSGFFKDSGTQIDLVGEIDNGNIVMQLIDPETNKPMGTLTFTPVVDGPWQFRVTGKLDLGPLLGEDESVEFVADDLVRLGVFDDRPAFLELLTPQGQSIKTPVIGWDFWLKRARAQAADTDGGRESATLEELIETIRRSEQPPRGE